MSLGCFNFTSHEQKLALDRSKKIDSKLFTRNKIVSEENKILLLGTDEIGKQTIYKQVKLIASGGYSEEELKSYIPIIIKFCITQIQYLISVMNDLQIDYENTLNIEKAKTISQFSCIQDSLSKSNAEDIYNLWNDKGIQQVYSLRNEYYHIHDSAEYFLSSIMNIIESNYIPTTDDIMNLPSVISKNGINKTDFDVEDFPFLLIDVSNIISEKRTWLHCFDNVTCVVFCVSLSEYNQTLIDDDSQNRMKESLFVFDETINSQWFKDIPVILLFTGYDIFEEKIKKVPLSVCFDDYKGPQTKQASIEHIRKSFLEMDNERNSKIYTHICSIDNTGIVKLLFNIVKSELRDKIMHENGISIH